MKFKLSQKELYSLNEWQKEHNKKCSKFFKTYCFKPVFDTVEVVVKCDCGNEINLTDIKFRKA